MQVKDLYKTTWEIKQKVLIDMAADRTRTPLHLNFDVQLCRKHFGCANTLRLLVGKTRAVTNECRLTKLCVWLLQAGRLSTSRSR